jgi:alkylation response protein AidB-like acyl-CoA dehydrogenase
MDGETKFNEVFFDDVKLFDSDILGEVGNGWKVAMSTLGRERLSLAAQSTIIFDKIGALSQIVSKDETSIGKFMSLSLVDVWARTYMLRLTWLRSFASQENAWLSQIVKLTASDIQKSLGDVGSSIEGSTSMLLSDDSFMSKHVLYAVGTSIAGGTSEIQKNIVAERILGMPK